MFSAFNPSKYTVVNCFLLKCRKLRREDQETSDWIVSRISLLRTQAVGSCSHRNLILSNFTRLFYRQNWRRDFLEVETKHQIKQASEGNKPNESTSGQDKVICRTKVKSLSSLTYWSYHYHRDKRHSCLELKWSGNENTWNAWHFLSQEVYLN